VVSKRACWTNVLCISSACPGNSLQPWKSSLDLTLLTGTKHLTSKPSIPLHINTPNQHISPLWRRRCEQTMRTRCFDEAVLYNLCQDYIDPDPWTEEVFFKGLRSTGKMGSKNAMALMQTIPHLTADMPDDEASPTHLHLHP
jgi:hypothetical protein